MGPPKCHSITSSARASRVGGHVEAERPGGDQVDDEIELGRLLDRQVGRLRPAQNLVDISAARRNRSGKFASIRHQAADFDTLAKACIVGSRMLSAKVLMRTRLAV